MKQYSTAKKPVPNRMPSGAAYCGSTQSTPVTRAQKRPGR